MIQYFCPNCFEKVLKEADHCPQCGHDIRAWEQSKTYAVRLLQALRHPIDQVRMGTIITLGNQGDPHTASALVECAYRFPTMIPQNLQIIRSLLRFPRCHEREIALELLAKHPSTPVARRAREVLEGAGGKRIGLLVLEQEHPEEPPPE